MGDKNKIRGEASSSGSNTIRSGGNTRGESVVVDVGRRRSSCGYCRSGGNSSISHGLRAHSLAVDDYQALLDRGWRRSGCFLYKPEMERTCCPSYTIRLKANDFVPAKEQSRVHKRMQRFLDGLWDGKKSHELKEESYASKNTSSLAHTEIISSFGKEQICNYEKKKKSEQIIQQLSESIDNVIRASIERGDFPSDVQLPKASVKNVVAAKRKLLVEELGDLLYSSNISFQIAAVFRRSAKNIDHLKLFGDNALDGLSYEITPKLISEKMVNSLDQIAEPLGLSVRACNGHINFYGAARQVHTDEVVRKVTASKESTSASEVKVCPVKKRYGCPPVKRRKLEIRLKRSSFDPEEYALYRKYQHIVHNDAPDRITENSYRRFLVDTPLVYVPSPGDGTVPPCGFGSFHQQYLIDGQLIAVGVIDILPKCLSSKYLFWDPDLAFLSLGKYSALQEIGWVQENQAHCASLQYYYLGYYIHSCSKMKYKAAYRPSELLCPLRYQWVPFDIAKPLLDRKSYAVLTDFATLENGKSLAPDLLVNNVEVMHDESCQEDLNDYPMDGDEEMSELEYEDSDDESCPESSGLPSEEIEDDVLSNISIGLKGSRLRYKDLHAVFGSGDKNYMDTQLRRYQKAVGAELSERMVYSLG